jgi:hypothetical protein
VQELERHIASHRTHVLRLEQVRLAYFIGVQNRVKSGSIYNFPASVVFPDSLTYHATT